MSVFYIQDFDTKATSFCREAQDRPYKIYCYVEFRNGKGCGPIRYTCAVCFTEYSAQVGIRLVFS